MDPLHDPDDEELLHPRQARELAGRVEAARLSSGSIRYGRTGRVAAANVVLNPDDPLPAGNHACGLWGTGAEVAGTLLRLERTFADSERSEAVVYASPTTVGEIEGIADDAGWRAVEENVDLVHRTPQFPGTRARPATDADTAGIAELVADDAGLSGEAETRLVRLLGHRLDDPRCLVRVIDDADAGPPRIAGFAQGFVEHGVGLVEHVVVRPGRRRRGIGSTLVSAVVAAGCERGATLVAAQAEEGGGAQRFAEECGFEVTYPVTTFARRIDELLD